MNKMKIMLAALLCSTAVLADEPKGLDKILPAVSDYSGDTDAAFLEAHQPLLKAPEEGAEKDAKYWAEAVVTANPASKRKKIFFIVFCIN